MNQSQISESQRKDLDLIYEINKDLYPIICWNPIRGFCGIKRLAYTVGLFYSLNRLGYKGRYCYHTMAEAVAALIEWDGNDDAPGEWIKHFGEAEYSHPNSTDPFAIKKPKTL